MQAQHSSAAIDQRANRSQFAFRVQGLEETAFAVQSFTGTGQALSQDYLFELSLSSKTAVAPAQVVGKPAVLELVREGAPVFFHGVVSEFSWAGSGAGGPEFVASLSSPLFLLKLRSANRVFLNTTVPQIIEEVLLGAGLAVEFDWQLQGEYALVEYTVQHHESDWDFITRLAARSGLFFRFEAQRDKVCILFHDSVDELPAVEKGTLPFLSQTGTSRERETIFAFNARAQLLSAQTEVRDYNYRTPEVTLEAAGGNSSKIPGHGSDYRFGENPKDLEQAQQLARVRQQGLDWQREVFLAETDCRAAVPGCLITMSGHPDPALNGSYLIVAAELQGDQGAAFAYCGQPKATSYRNRLTLIPCKVPYRPPLPEPRRIHGVITARVESPGGQYAHLDAQGRYRVRLHSDGANTAPGEASHPVRLMQPYAGPNYGLHLPLHPGTEVALTFVNGDLDRPVMLGALPNRATPTLVTSANNSQNILRTFGGNELLMEDRKGQEKTELFTRERKNLLSLDANRSGHQVRLAAEEGEMDVEAAKTMLLESGDTHRTISGNDHLVTVENAQRLTTKKAAIDLQAATDIRMKAALKVDLLAEQEDILLKADKNMVIQAGEGMSVEVRNQNLHLRVTDGALSIDVAGELNILGEGGGAINIGQSGGQIEIDPEGNISIDSHTVDINGDSVNISGSQNAQGGGGGGGTATAGGGFGDWLGDLFSAGVEWFDDTFGEEAQAGENRSAEAGDKAAGFEDTKPNVPEAPDPEVLKSDFTEEKRETTPERKVLVRKVEGPSESEVGEKIRYSVSEFNVSNPTPEEKKLVNWRIETHCSEVLSEYKNHGESLELKIDENLLGKPIRVYAYVNEPAKSASAATIISKEFNLLIATVYGEAGNSSETAWRAVASVIKNRVNYREWKKHKNISEVIKKSGFDAYWQNTKQFNIANDYLSSVSETKNSLIDKIVTALTGIYIEKSEPFSDIVLYFSPKAQKLLHSKYPSLYAEKPKWNFELLREVKIEGLYGEDDFQFYKYK